MKHWLPKVWQSRGWLARGLWPVALAYGAVMRIRSMLYRLGVLKSERFPVAVVVVGNVVAGGAGKTPLVIALIRHLQAQGCRAGVVSRGYGRSGHETLEVAAQVPVESSGDEPALVKRATGAPVFVAPKRADALRALLLAYPETRVVVCDDGLQHYALQRDIEIAVFDDRGIGNGWLLPAGPLREPWPERARRGIELLLHTGRKPAFAGFSSSRRLADHAVSATGRQIGLSELQTQPVVALAAIAEPEAFFQMLRQRGITLKKTITLADHHDFHDFDLVSLAGQTVLCTEKDAVKLFSRPSVERVNLLAVPLEFAPEPAFLAAFDLRLASVVSQLPSRHGHETS